MFWHSRVIPAQAHGNLHPRALTHVVRVRLGDDTGEATDFGVYTSLQRRSEWDSLDVGCQLLSRKLFSNGGCRPTTSLTSSLVRPLLRQLKPETVYPSDHVRHLKGLTKILPTVTGLAQRPLYSGPLELVQYAGPQLGTLTLLLPAYIHAIESVGVALPDESLSKALQPFTSLREHVGNTASIAAALADDIAQARTHIFRAVSTAAKSAPKGNLQQVTEILSVPVNLGGECVEHLRSGDLLWLGQVCHIRDTPERQPGRCSKSAPAGIEHRSP